MGRRARTHALTANRRPFPLVPRRRFAGTPFGERRTSRRGRGSDVAATRPYVPGDRISTIDWRASARLSSARDSDEFVVRETFLEEAPRVLVVEDRRPPMGFYRPPLPWLDKHAAVLAAVEAIAHSAVAARAEAGHAAVARGRVRLVAPGSIAPACIVERVRTASLDAPAGSLEAVLRSLLSRRRQIPQSTFLFVISDFIDAIAPATLVRLQRAKWDVVPVVVQDPTWEQSFPEVGGAAVPFAGASGETALVRLSRAECARLRQANEERLATTLRRFRRLGFDPLVLGDAEPSAVGAAFLKWAERRRIRSRR